MDALNKCKSFKAEHYMNLDMNRLAIYGIWYLEENKIENTFENLVVCLFRLFPKKFHLKSYENYPGSSKVLRTLMQLRPKYRNWAIKNEKGGYELNENGRAVLRQTMVLLESKDFQKKVVEEPIIFDEVNFILGSVPYQKFIDGKTEDIQVFELFKLFGFASHTPQQKIEKKFKDLKRKSKEIKNNELEKFIAYARKMII